MPQISALFIIVIMLGGCGDIYTKEETAPVSTAAAVNSGVHAGVLTDSPIQGVSYKTSSGLTGTTNKQGGFYYYPNDTITFNIGNVELGVYGVSVKAQARLTPVELTVASAYINKDTVDQTTAPTNLSRLLQSLDSDSYLTNGIEINASTTAIAGNNTITGIVFGKSSNDFTEDSNVTTLLNGKTLIDSQTALTHLKETLDAKFTSAMVAGKTFTALWEMGSNYITYIFNPSINGSVEIYEESRIILGKGKLNGSWNITDGKVKITGIKDNTTNETFDDQTLTLLGITDTSTYLVQNSDVYKDFGAMRADAQHFTVSDVNGTTYSLLTVTGDYAIFDFNQTGTNVQAIFPEDNNVTLTWNVVAGKVETNGTVAGAERNDTIVPLVNQGSIYKSNHTNSLVGSAKKATWVQGTLPFFNTMIPGTYHCVTNKGLYYKLVMNTGGTGTMDYLKNTEGSFTTEGAVRPVAWSIVNSKLDMRGIYNETNSETSVNIIKELRALSSNVYLVKNTSGFMTGVDEYEVMYKQAPAKTASDLVGTYLITIEEYNNTSAEVSKTQSSEVHLMKFLDDKTGYTDNNNTSDAKHYADFTWTINSDRTITRKDIANNWFSTMIILHEHDDVLKVVEEYHNDNSGSSVVTKFYTFTKQ